MERTDFLKELREICGSFKDYVNGQYPDSEYLIKMMTYVDPLLEVDKPKIMVYGIYNSGKSTLVNALCHEEVAQVADRPMTATIDEFDRGDYILIDSPGVDAPIEHEQITEAYLNKCHIILFVMSTKGIFEDLSNYKRMDQLIKKKIPFIIVLNDRGCPLSADDTAQEKEYKKAKHKEELLQIHYKVIENLKKVSHDPDVSKQYEIIEVNAKRALKGVLESKPKLYESSRIEILNKRIYQILQDTKALNFFRQPINNLLEIMASIEASLRAERSGKSDVDFENRINVVIMKKNNLLEEMRIYIRDIVYGHADEMARAILNGDETAYANLKNVILNEVGECFISHCEGLMHFINTNFKDLNIKVNNLVELSTASNAPDDNQSHPEMPKITPMEVKIIDSPVSNYQGEKSAWDIIKELFMSKRKKQERELQRMKDEVEIANQNAQHRLAEEIRQRQSSRQEALIQLDALHKQLLQLTNESLRNKFDEVISAISYATDLNKEECEIIDRKLSELKVFQNKLNALSDMI